MNDKLTLPIVLGRRYVRRDGFIVTARKPAAPFVQSALACVVDNEHAMALSSSHVWLADGRVSSEAEHSNDLVADASALTLPIQVGRKYVRRDGVVITARNAEPGFSSDLAWVAAPGEADLATTHVWRRIGRSHSAEDRHCDLVADYIAPELVDAEAPKGHPHAALMALYAQDAAETAEPWKRWQARGTAGAWSTCSSNPTWCEDSFYRRKPKPIRIGEFDVPEPMREALAAGTRYFVPSILVGRGSTFSSKVWGVMPDFDGMALDAGFMHATQEAAELHARALLSFTKAAA